MLAVFGEGGNDSLLRGPGQDIVTVFFGKIFAEMR